MAHRKRIGKIGTLHHIDGRSIGGVISHAVNGLIGMKRAVLTIRKNRQRWNIEALLIK